MRHEPSQPVVIARGGALNHTQPENGQIGGHGAAGTGEPALSTLIHAIKTTPHGVCRPIWLQLPTGPALIIVTGGGDTDDAHAIWEHLRQATASRPAPPRIGSFALADTPAPLGGYTLPGHTTTLSTGLRDGQTRRVARLLRNARNASRNQRAFAIALAPALSLRWVMGLADRAGQTLQVVLGGAAAGSAVTLTAAAAVWVSPLHAEDSGPPEPRPTPVVHRALPSSPPSRMAVNLPSRPRPAPASPTAAPNPNLETPPAVSAPDPAPSTPAAQTPAPEPTAEPPHSLVGEPTTPTPTPTVSPTPSETPES